MVTRNAAQSVSVALRSVTDARTSVAHLVTDDAIAVGRYLGCYVACCGVIVLPSALTGEESGHCRSCQRWAQQ